MRFRKRITRVPYYWDDINNRNICSSEISAREDAMRKACSLMRQGHVVSHVAGLEWRTHRYSRYPRVVLCACKPLVWRLDTAGRTRPLTHFSATTITRSLTFSGPLARTYDPAFHDNVAVRSDPFASAKSHFFDTSSWGAFCDVTLTSEANSPVRQRCLGKDR